MNDIEIEKKERLVASYEVLRAIVILCILGCIRRCCSASGCCTMLLSISGICGGTLNATAKRKSFAADHSSTDGWSNPAFFLFFMDISTPLVEVEI